MELNKSYCFGYFNPYSSKPKGALITQDEGSLDVTLNCKSSMNKLEDKVLREIRSYKPAPLICYYYDSNGKIAHNPAPQNFVDITELPYLPAISRPKTKTQHLRNVISTDGGIHARSYNVADFKIREICVVRYDKKNSEGFMYSIDTYSQKTKMQLVEEYRDLLRFASKQFKCKRKFKIAFAEDGKVLHNLSEIPLQSKFIYVGWEPFTQFDSKSAGMDVLTSSCKTSTKNQSSPNPEEVESFTYRNRVKSLRSHKAPRMKYQNVQSLPISTSNIEKLAKANFFKRGRTLTPVKKSHSEKYRGDYLKYSKLARLKIQEALCKLDSKYPPLSHETIENLSKEFGFTHTELHKLYAKFKSSLILNIAKDPYHDFSKGIDRDTFIDTVSQGNCRGRELLGKIFDKIDTNGNGNIDWKEFITAIHTVNFGNMNQKIDLFFSLYDQDNNGKMSFDEAQMICKLQIGDAVQPDLLDEIAKFFALAIYDIAEVDYSSEITSKRLKELFTEKANEKDLIEMFCSFGFLKSFKLNRKS